LSRTVYTIKVKPKRALERSKSSRRYRLNSPTTRVKAVAMDSASAKEDAHVQPKRWKRLFARSMSEPCTACVHGAPSRVPTQRSTPDAGANARSQPSPPCSADSHAPQICPTAPCPGVAASAAGEARSRDAHNRAPALRSAPPREARERGRGGRGAGGDF